MTHVVHTELIQSLGDLNLLLGVEESVGELLTLTESGLNDLESRDVAQEVGDTDAVTVGVTGGVRVVASLNSSEAGVVGFSNKQVSGGSQRLNHSTFTYHYQWPGHWHRWPAHWARSLHRGTLWKSLWWGNVVAAIGEMRPGICAEVRHQASSERKACKRHKPQTFWDRKTAVYMLSPQIWKRIKEES